MASTHDMAKYSIWKYASKTIEIDNFQTKTTNHDRKDECVSSNDDSFKFLVQLWSSLENKQTSSGYVYFSLQTYYKCLPESVVKFVVSLIDVKGEKQFTLSFCQASSLLEKEPIHSQFTSRRNILASPHTNLHNGTLKVLFEVLLLKEERSVPLTPLTSDYASLLADGTFSDVTLVVGKKEFPVHKAILSARSPVFERMFASHFKESKENRVVLEDMSEEVLQELLNFIYTERITNAKEHASELLMVAEKYQIESLKKICGLSLSTTLNTDTLLPLLQMATLYNVPELKTKCLAFFARNSKEIELSAEWKQFIIAENNLDLLGLLLQSVMRSQVD